MSRSTKVNVDNFVRAETARMFDAGLVVGTSGFNEFVHAGVPAVVENQPVIRMNRDTLYSSALVNISAGATVTLPDAGDRYISMMVVNENHYINRIYRAGAHIDSPWTSSRHRSSVWSCGCSSIPTILTT
jgi:hypothetical protein